VTTPLPLWVTIPGTVLLVVGGLLTVIGSIGLIRLESFFARMHGPSLGNTLGAGCVLISSMLTSSALLDRVVLHEIVIAACVFINSPVTAMLLMRAAAYRTIAKERTNRENNPRQTET
jgi:multicomponent K+:H+ antiporter subunit G